MDVGTQELEPAQDPLVPLRQLRVPAAIGMLPELSNEAGAQALVPSPELGSVFTQDSGLFTPEPLLLGHVLVGLQLLVKEDGVKLKPVAHALLLVASWGLNAPAHCNTQKQSFDK